MPENPASRRAVIGLGLAAIVTGVTASTAMAAGPAIALNPATGPVGSKITVTGTGFPALASGTITAGSASVAFKTLKTGAFNAVITIPSTTLTTLPVAVKVGKTTLSSPFAVKAPAMVPLPPLSSSPLRFGLITPGGMGATAELDAVSRLVGEQPTIILGYKDFQQPAPIAELNSVTGRGAVPLVTWEPWVAGGAIQPDYTLAAIAGGNFDAYISKWGTDLAAWGKPVMLRFAHEMNGDWYPWCGTINGNQPADYIRAWQHVHRLITAAGASNVTWVWSPNGGGPGDMAAMYPGDEYVDVLGLDAYNWGTTQTWSSWLSPEAVYGYWLDQLRAIAPGKQIILAETASTETGGSKADWIAALIPYLKAQPDVTAFIWFNLNKETDWRINSSQAAATAFTAALAARR
jgi:hypothetical protein